MSIVSIGSSAFSPVFALRLRSFAEDSSSDAAATQPSTSACAAAGMCTAPLPAPPPEAPGGLTVRESHLALQIRSRTQLRTASDGTVSERSSTKLRFHYDLTTADGQHIELNVKAKVRQVSIQDAAGNSFSKTQVKLQFSLLQEGVTDGLSPLQSDQAPSDTQSGVADGLQAFLNSVGDVLQQFVEGDTVTADDLIRKTVDAFNSLVDALANLLFPPAENEAPPALPTSDEASGLIPATAPPPLDNSDLSPAEPAAVSPPPAALSPLLAEGVVTNESSEPETQAVASGDNSVVDVPAIPADPIPAGPIPQDQVAPLVQPAAAEVSAAEVSVAPPADSDAAASPTQLAATQVLQTIRFRFVQSLTQIIRTLTPEEQSGNSSSASFQRLYYRSSLSLRIHSASLLDVHV